jgi:hypothetical protein
MVTTVCRSKSSGCGGGSSNVVRSNINGRWGLRLTVTETEQNLECVPLVMLCCEAWQVLRGAADCRFLAKAGAAASR